MLDRQIKKRLSWEDGGRQPETPDRIAEMFREAGLPSYPAVVQSFSTFGGGRFHRTEVIDTPHFKADRFTTGFKIPYASEVLRRVKKEMRRHPDRFSGFDEPTRFRIEFAESDRCHEAFTMDGHGQVYEAGVRIAGSIEEWLETLSRT